ncbi:MAG: hypothetical protein IBX55_00560 [Methyloprofundus sp.]|nr:hypothetical protein [Methyloprofundus sp.]
MSFYTVIEGSFEYDDDESFKEAVGLLDKYMDQYTGYDFRIIFPELRSIAIPGGHVSGLSDFLEESLAAKAARFYFIEFCTDGENWAKTGSHEEDIKFYSNVDIAADIIKNNKKDVIEYFAILGSIEGYVRALIDNGYGRLDIFTQAFLDDYKKIDNTIDENIKDLIEVHPDVESDVFSDMRSDMNEVLFDFLQRTPIPVKIKNDDDYLEEIKKMEAEKLDDYRGEISSELNSSANFK